MKKQIKLVANNKKAYHDYFVDETYEAGIVLTGTEIKSVRQGKVSIKEAYVRIRNGEAIVQGMNISPYEQGNRFNVDPLRDRKLLLHKQEIRKLTGKLTLQGMTLIPLKMYINEDGRKNLRYAVGDAFYAVDRSGRGYVGRGGAEEGFVCSVYEDPEAKGNAYYAEFRIPLRSVTGRYDREIGFDVRINNAFEGECVHVVQWADTSGKTEITMTGVGTVRMD